MSDLKKNKSVFNKCKTIATIGYLIKHDLPNFDEIWQKPLVNSFSGVCHVAFSSEFSLF